MVSAVAKWPYWWPELIGSLVAIAGLLTSILLGFRPAEWPWSASDLKTLYAAALCFRMHIDPYNFHNIAAVFAANHVISPPSWYGHAPVYPPFTLAVIAPLTLLHMVPATYVFIFLSALALAFAALALVVAATRLFTLTRPWRFVLIGLFAASPILSFGLEMCNVSMAVAALSILAVLDLGESKRRAILAAFALGLALLLKPHLALWTVVALILSRSRLDRSLARRAVAIATAVSLAVILWMAATHRLLPDIGSYRAMVHSEVAGGSMSASNNELLGVAAQITAAESLFAYWLRGLALDIATGITLAALAAGLIFASLKADSRNAPARLLRICAWSSFGLLATYHRAHDGGVLLLSLPYLVSRLRTNWHDAFAWACLVLLGLMGGGLTWQTTHWLASFPGLWHASYLILYRQAPIAAMLLTFILLAENLRATVDYWPSVGRSLADIPMAEAA